MYEKLHFLLVGNPKLINDIGLVLVDELQYLTDEERGPVLEILLTRILLNPKQPQIVDLSAVLGKSEDLAQWLRAKIIKEEKRPVEFRQGVFFDGKFGYRKFNSGRVFYCFIIGQRVVILHAFVKKTPDTPEPEFRIARKRMKEVRNG
jgi:replicative superfamily II helicase